MENICFICNQLGEFVVSIDFDGKRLEDLTTCEACLDELAEEGWLLSQNRLHFSFCGTKTCSASLFGRFSPQLINDNENSLHAWLRRSSVNQNCRDRLAPCRDG